MWLIGLFKKLKKRKEEESIESIQHRIASNRIDSASNRIDSASINRSIQPVISKEEKEEKEISLEKDSLKLGVAAGFTGRALLDIEHSLSRIESLMLSKEWFSTNFGSKMDKIYETLSYLKENLAEHEKNEEKRFEAIASSINSLRRTAASLPEPFKTTIISQTRNIEKAVLTPRMKELIDLVKTRGEMSYAELSQRLGISQDALRGFLSRIVRITSEIERFEKAKRGWVRFRSDSTRIESNRIDASEPENQENAAFKELK